MGWVGFFPGLSVRRRLGTALGRTTSIVVLLCGSYSGCLAD